MAEASSIYEKQTDSKTSVHPVQTVFLEKAKLAGEACARGDFEAAIELYSEAIELDPENHVLYGNRSAAYIRTLEYSRALDDGRKAAELQPLWSKFSLIVQYDYKHTSTALVRAGNQEPEEQVVTLRHKVHINAGSIDGATQV